MKIATVADVPDELGQAWLQHLRNFDVANPGCHFQVIAVTDTDASTDEIQHMLDVGPPFQAKRIVKQVAGDD